MGKPFNKVLKSVYLGMSLTASGLAVDRNEERLAETEERMGGILQNARLSMRAPKNRLNYIIVTFLCSRYAYNVGLLDDVSELEKGDERICKRSFSIILRATRGGIRDSAIGRLRALFKIIPMWRKRDKEAHNFVTKVTSIEQGEWGRQEQGRRGCLKTMASRNEISMFEEEGATTLLEEAFVDGVAGRGYVAAR